MSQIASSFKQQKSDAGVARVDMKFEVSLVPVSDVDRVKEFYTRLGCQRPGPRAPELPLIHLLRRSRW